MSGPVSCRRMLACLGVLLLFAGFSGCDLISGEEPLKVERPPDIPPAPRQARGRLPDEGEGQPTFAVSGLSEQRSAALQKALAIAINRGLVSPEATVSSVRLDDPVTRGDFAYWLAGFRQIPAVESDFPSFEDVSPDHKYFAAIEAVNIRGLMKGRVYQGEPNFFPDKPISREEFARLYTELTRQTKAAQGLSGMLRGELKPENASGSAQSFENIRDYESISREFRNDVALAYRDGVLEKTFGLTPKELVEGEGFNPARHMTRLEALVFLFEQFGG